MAYVYGSSTCLEKLSFSPKKKLPTGRKFTIILHIWKIKVYVYIYILCMIALNVRAGHGSCGPSTKAPWFRFCYVWSCVSTISTITRHKSLSSSQWGHFHDFLDTIYRIQCFSNLCLKLLSNAHFAIFAPRMSPDSTRCDALHLNPP